MTTAEPATRTKTSYVVLRKVHDAHTADVTTGTTATAYRGEGWETVGKPVDATNSADAIKQAAGKTEGSYIAVPARSFQPVKVTVTQQTIVRLD